MAAINFVALCAVFVSFCVLSANADHYSVLGVPRKATLQQIKKAYHEQARIWHPDKNKAPDAQKRFLQIKDAFETLSDPKKRAMYDQSGVFQFDIFSKLESLADEDGWFTVPTSFNEQEWGHPDHMLRFKVHWEMTGLLVALVVLIACGLCICTCCIMAVFPTVGLTIVALVATIAVSALQVLVSESFGESA